MSLLPYAVESGINPSEFWDMTPAEIFAVTNHYADTRSQNLKMQISLNYDLAVMVNNALAGKLKSKFDMYPELFETEAREAALKRFKTTMMEYASIHNAKWEKERGED